MLMRDAWFFSDLKMLGGLGMQDAGRNSSAAHVYFRPGSSLVTPALSAEMAKGLGVQVRLVLGLVANPGNMYWHVAGIFCCTIQAQHRDLEF